METIHLIILGLIQGLTEFLPVSSSAHLILFPALMGWQDQGIVYDVAVHTGSLGAVLLYFRSDIALILQGFAANFSGAEKKDWTLIHIAVATVPVGLAGLLLHDLISGSLRSPMIIAMASIFFGLVLYWADKSGAGTRGQEDIGMRDAIIIGCAQALALIPGTSRSGITITAGLVLGLDPASASRFSFLMAIPVIILATGLELYKLSSATVEVEIVPLVSVIVVSFASAWLAIHYFLKLLQRTGMLPYVIYRVLLGLFLIGIFW